MVSNIFIKTKLQWGDVLDCNEGKKILDQVL